MGTEVITSVLARAGDGWAEALLPGQNRRAAALAVLPTLTEVSRASLLCGELRTGGQDAEQRGYEALTRAHRLPGAALVPQEAAGFLPARVRGRRRRGRGYRRRDRPAAGHLRAEHDRRCPGPFGSGRHRLGHRRGQAPRAAARPRPPRGPDRRPDRGPRARRGTPPGHAARVRRHLQRPVPRGDRARGRRGGAGRGPAGAAARRAGGARRRRAPAVRAAEGRLPRRRPPRPRPWSRWPSWCPARSPRTSACTWRRRRSRPGGSTPSRPPSRSAAPPPAAAPAPRPAGDYRRRPQDAAPTLFDEPDTEPAPAAAGPGCPAQPGPGGGAEVRRLRGAEEGRRAGLA